MVEAKAQWPRRHVHIGGIASCVQPWPAHALTRAAHLRLWRRREQQVREQMAALLCLQPDREKFIGVLWGEEQAEINGSDLNPSYRMLPSNTSTASVMIKWVDRNEAMLYPFFTSI